MSVKIEHDCDQGGCRSEASYCYCDEHLADLEDQSEQEGLKDGYNNGYDVGYKDGLIEGQKVAKEMPKVVEVPATV